MLSVESKWTVFKRRLLQVLATEVIVDNEHNRPLLLRWRTHRLTEESFRKALAPGEEGRSGKKGQKACRSFFKGKCTNLSCDNWHPPVCQNYISESGCKFGDKLSLRPMGSTSKKSKRSGGKGSVALLMETKPLGCVSQDAKPPKKSIQRKSGKLGSNCTVSLSKGTWHHLKKIGKERVHRKEVFKSVNLKNAIRVRQNLRTGHFRKLCNKKDAPAEMHGVWRKMSLSSKQRTRPHWTPPPKHG